MISTTVFAPKCILDEFTLDFSQANFCVFLHNFLQNILIGNLW